MRAWNEENVSEVHTRTLLRSHHALREALAVLDDSAAFSTRQVARDMRGDLRVLQGELHRREALEEAVLQRRRPREPRGRHSLEREVV